MWLITQSRRLLLSVMYSIAINFSLTSSVSSIYWLLIQKGCAAVITFDEWIGWDYFLMFDFFLPCALLNEIQSFDKTSTELKRKCAFIFNILTWVDFFCSKWYLFLLHHILPNISYTLPSSTSFVLLVISLACYLTWWLFLCSYVRFVNSTFFWKVYSDGNIYLSRSSS